MRVKSLFWWNQSRLRRLIKNSGNIEIVSLGRYWLRNVNFVFGATTARPPPPRRKYIMKINCHGDRKGKYCLPWGVNTFRPRIIEFGNEWHDASTIASDNPICQAEHRAIEPIIEFYFRRYRLFWRATKCRRNDLSNPRRITLPPP